MIQLSVLSIGPDISYFAIKKLSLRVFSVHQSNEHHAKVNSASTTSDAMTIVYGESLYKISSVDKGDYGELLTGHFA